MLPFIDGRLSFVKCRDTSRFWLEGEGMGSDLPHTLGLRIRVEKVVVLVPDLLPRGFAAPCRVFVLHCLSLT